MIDDRQLLHMLFDAAVAAASPAACVPLWLEDKPAGNVIVAEAFRDLVGREAARDHAGGGEC